MPWIETIAYADAGGRLRQLYERITRPGGPWLRLLNRARRVRPLTRQRRRSEGLVTRLDRRAAPGL